MFKITQNKGFHLSFENGLTVSVQFGAGNYCGNKRMALQGTPDDKDCECKTAEIAVFKTDSGEWMTRKFFKGIGDDVLGYLSADEVALLIRRVKMRKV